MIKIITYIIGVLLICFSICFIVINLNLLSFGYSFLEYVKFITSKINFYYLFIGLFLIYISLIRKGKI